MDNEESKLFILLRSDVEINASELVRALSRSFFKSFKECESEPELKNRLYDYINYQPAYPKICKRYKQKHINGIIKGIEFHKSLNIQNTEIVLENDEIVGYIIGPCKRSELFNKIEKLQLMDECLVNLNEDFEIEKYDVVIGYRNDIEIPPGKLVAQLCHAIQKYYCSLTNFENNLNFCLTKMDLKSIMATNNYIVDAARTYFKEPTVTTCYYLN